MYMHIDIYTHISAVTSLLVASSCPSSTLNKYIPNSILSKKKKGVAHGD